MVQSSLESMVDELTVTIAGMQAGQPLMEQELDLLLTEIVPILETCLLCFTVRYDLFIKYTPIFDILINDLITAATVFPSLLSRKSLLWITPVSLLLASLASLPNHVLSDSISSLLLQSVTHSLLLLDSPSSSDVTRSFWLLVARSWQDHFAWTLHVEKSCSEQLATVAREAFCRFFNCTSDVLRNQMITAVIASFHQDDKTVNTAVMKSVMAHRICCLFHRLLLSIQKSGHVLEFQQWVGIVRDVLTSALSSTDEENRSLAEESLIRLSEMGIEIEGDLFVRVNGFLRKRDCRLDDLHINTCSKEYECIRSCVYSSGYLIEEDREWVQQYCSHYCLSIQDEGTNDVIDGVARLCVELSPFGSNQSDFLELTHMLRQLAITPSVLMMIARLVELDPSHSLNDQILSYFWNAIKSSDFILQQGAISTIHHLIPFFSPPVWLFLRCLQLHQTSVM